MAKTKFGTTGPQVVRSYATDAVIGAGLAVIAGAAFNSVALPGGANVRALGVTAQGNANIGDPISVVEAGEVTAVADAAIARGNWVMVNAATGKLAPVGAVAGTNYETVGIALEAAAAQNDEFLLLVIPQRVQG
jgi:hypothetical protein